ncbi:ABC transporter permease [Bifidobacterium dolichotidis]|uniref:ABC transporter permease n=1 Tax=Bifidobacterium dolichotidis TaxID=2306976 RepID=A0A430FKQ2_9BIFI|nr:ABC transporter permease [Bifidobacterium dolichotidis]RSX53360.1 ABC transporter permease [Bifidobacterium dolichotidis]
MFALKNAWAALMRHKLRTVLIMLVSALTMFGTVVCAAIVHQADYMNGEGYNRQQPYAQLQMKPSLLKTRTSDNSDWTKHYVSWDQYTKLATELNSKNIQFNYTVLESVPVQSTKSLKPITSDATSDVSQDKTGGDFTLQSLFTEEALSVNPWGHYEIVKGKNIDLTQNAQLSSAIISEDLAKKNNLKVGDKFSIGTATDANKTHEYTIAGLYKYTGAPLDSTIQADGSKAKFAKDDRNNVIYISAYTLSADGFDVPEGKGWAKPYVDIVFMFNSPAEYDEFKKIVAKSDLGKDYSVTSYTLDRYAESHKGLDNIRQNMLIVMICTLSIGGALLLLLVLLGCVPRRDEIGNAMIMGVNKIRLGFQFMIEVFIPMIVGALIGWLIGINTANPIGNSVSGTNLMDISGTVKGDAAWIGALAVLLFMIIAAVRVALFPKMSLFANPYSPSPNSIERDELPESHDGKEQA